MSRKRDWDTDRRYRRALENGRENVDGTWRVDGLGTLSKTTYRQHSNLPGPVSSWEPRPKSPVLQPYAPDVAAHTTLARKRGLGGLLARGRPILWRLAIISVAVVGLLWFILGRR
jgi:hypothetical protein